MRVKLQWSEVAALSKNGHAPISSARQVAILMFLGLGCSMSSHANNLAETPNNALAANGDIERINVTFLQHDYAWLRTSAALNQRVFSAQFPALDTASLLQGIAGLQADQRGNFAQDSRISLRGFGTRSSFGVRGVEITLDGIPLSTPDGQVQPSTLMLDQLQQVEVLKGPFATLYGNASGGVIAFTSKEELKDSVYFRQQHSAWQNNSTIVLGTEYGEIAWTQSYHQGYRAHNSAQKRQAYWRKSWDLAENLSFSLRYDWANDPLLQDPLALSEAEWRADPSQTASSAILFDTKKTSAQRGFSANLAYADEAYNWQFSSWQLQREITQYLAFTGEAPTSAGGIVDLNRQMQGFKGRWQQTTGFGAWQLFGGAEQSRDKRLGAVNQFGNLGPLRRDETGTVKSQDLGSYLHFALDENFDTYAGLRLNRQQFRVNDWFITPANPDDSGQRSDQHYHWALGSTYQLNTWQSLNLSVGEGYESPTLTEMAYSSSSSGLNLALKAAKALQLQAGWKYAKAGRTLSIDIFHIATENELLVDQSLGGRTSYRNAAATRRIGAEFSGQWQLTPSWQHQLSLTSIDARFRTPSEPLLQDRILPGLAKQQLSWQISWLPLKSDFWQLQSVVDYKSRMAADDRNQVFAPASTIWRLQSRWQGELYSGQWQAWLAAENITNTRYVGAVVVNQGNGRSFEPGVPRQLLAGFQYNYQLN